MGIINFYDMQLIALDSIFKKRQSFHQRQEFWDVDQDDNETFDPKQNDAKIHFTDMQNQRFSIPICLNFKRLHRCWWRMLETKWVGDKFEMLVTDLIHRENHNFY